MAICKVYVRTSMLASVLVIVDRNILRCLRSSSSSGEYRQKSVLECLNFLFKVSTSRKKEKRKKGGREGKSLGLSKRGATNTFVCIQPASQPASQPLPAAAAAAAAASSQSVSLFSFIWFT